MDDLNKPDITIAYFIGGAEEGWVKQRFPKAKFLGVANSGATAPLEDIMARRADAAPINRIPYVPMSHKVKGLAVLPSANNCQGSTEKAQPVGVAIDKKQPVFLAWLRAVEKSIHPEARSLRAEGDRGNEVIDGRARSGGTCLRTAYVRPLRQFRKLPELP